MYCMSVTYDCHQCDGLAVGLSLAYIVAALRPAPNHYYFEIMLPGALVGTIIGYATQRFGRASQPAAQ